MAREYADKGFAFLFVYTREAHPGQHYPAHRGQDQKLAHARAFKDHFEVQRPILVDDLAGTGHHLFGALPNMTYLISRAGKVLFRADWTDPPTIRHALDYVLLARNRRREGLRLMPFYAELAGYRWNDPEKFEEGLRRNGQQATDDWLRFVESQKAGGVRPGRIDLKE